MPFKIVNVFFLHNVFSSSKFILLLSLFYLFLFSLFSFAGFISNISILSVFVTYP